MLASSGGKLPLSMLSLRSNRTNPVSLPSCEGTAPAKELRKRSSAHKSVSDPSCDGTLPVNEFPYIGCLLARTASCR